jgi:hypothetical protein
MGTNVLPSSGPTRPSNGCGLPDGHQSFVAGPPVHRVQIMVEDSKKYASTGGWRFAQFDDGKPANDAMLMSCFACHALIKDRDLVFTRYAP